MNTSIRADIKAAALDHKTALADIQEVKNIHGKKNFINAAFEQFKEDVETVCLQMSLIKKEQAESTEEVRQLCDQIKEVRQELIGLKQYSRRNNLEIKGAPTTPDESLHTMMLNIAGIVKQDLQAEDIEVVHRVSTKDKNQPNIVARFILKKCVIALS